MVSLAIAVWENCILYREHGTLGVEIVTIGLEKFGPGTYASVGYRIPTHSGLRLLVVGEDCSNAQTKDRVIHL